MNTKKRYLMLGKRHQVTLPGDCVRDDVTLFQCDLRDDGSILLTPQVPVPAAQAYFWTKDWQEGEKQASKDIRAGRLHRLDSAETLSDTLERRRRR